MPTQFKVHYLVKGKRLPVATATLFDDARVVVAVNDSLCAVAERQGGWPAEALEQLTRCVTDGVHILAKTGADALEDDAPALNGTMIITRVATPKETQKFYVLYTGKMDTPAAIATLHKDGSVTLDLNESFAESAANHPQAMVNFRATVKELVHKLAATTEDFIHRKSKKMIVMRESAWLQHNQTK